MRTLTTVFVAGLFATLVVSAALFAFAISALPYVAVGTAIAVLIKSRQRPTAAASQSLYRYSPAPPVTARPIPPSGWVYVPLWMGPPPQATLPVIDAEVIEDSN